MSRDNMTDFVRELETVTLDQGTAMESVWEIKAVAMIEYFPKWLERVAEGSWCKAQAST